jgi:hypothetical protein
MDYFFLLFAPIVVLIAVVLAKDAGQRKHPLRSK